MVLLDFFATWCAPCKSFVSTLKEVKAQFSASQLVIISIDIDPDHDIDSDAYGINRRHDEVCPNCYKPIFFGVSQRRIGSYLKLIS